MSTFLVCKVGDTTKSYTCKTTASKPYLRVKDAYLPLTTETGTGLKVKANGNTYRPLETYTTTIEKGYWSGAETIKNSDSTMTLTATRVLTVKGTYTSSSNSNTKKTTYGTTGATFSMWDDYNWMGTVFGLISGTINLQGFIRNNSSQSSTSWTRNSTSNTAFIPNVYSRGSVTKPDYPCSETFSYHDSVSAVETRSSLYDARTYRFTEKATNRTNSIYPIVAEASMARSVFTYITLATGQGAYYHILSFEPLCTFSTDESITITNAVSLRRYTSYSGGDATYNRSSSESNETCSVYTVTATETITVGG